MISKLKIASWRKLFLPEMIALFDYVGENFMKLDNIMQDKTNTVNYYGSKKSSFDFHQILEDKGKENDDKVKNDSVESTVHDYQAMLSEHILYLQEKLQNGEIQEKFQIGNESMTIGEWNHLLDNFDSLQEEILLGMRERHEIQEEKQERKEVLRKLFEDRELLEELRTKENYHKKEKKEALADQKSKEEKGE